jgi:hypothetical protein
MLFVSDSDFGPNQKLRFENVLLEIKGWAARRVKIVELRSNLFGRPAAASNSEYFLQFVWRGPNKVPALRKKRERTGHPVT